MDLNPMHWDMNPFWFHNVWNVLKWIFMAIVIISVLFLVYDMNKYKTMLKNERLKNDNHLTTLRQILYDTRGNDNTLLRMLVEYEKKQ